MAREATGQFYTWIRRDGITGYGVRFRYGGKRRFVKLGSSADMTEKKARAAMADLMADVRRDLWTPPEERRPEREIPTFHEFASKWYVDLVDEGGIGEKAARDLRDWRLKQHILPTLADYRLDEIGVEVIDDYRRAKVREGRLSPSSINKMITTIAAVLEVAVEYRHLPANPAKGRRRRLKTAKPRRTYLDRAEQIEALLDAADGLDANRRTGDPYRRALLATLAFAGLRIGELRELRWSDVDLAGGRLGVRGTKTENAARTVRLLPALHYELAALKERRSPERTELVFATSTGRAIGESNVRKRILAPAVEAANRALADADVEPISEGFTPHSLRRTFCSLLIALGEDPARAKKQTGHSTSTFLLDVYTAAMDWSDGQREQLAAVVRGKLVEVPAVDLALREVPAAA